MSTQTDRKITMIIPVPVPPEALDAFAKQIPPEFERPGLTVEFVCPRNGARLVDSYYELALAEAFVLDAGVKAAENGADAICINTMSDSAMHALRSRLDIPVIGPCQASFLTACMLGKKFSVITMWPQWNIIYEKTATEQGITGRMASVRNIGVRPDTAELLSGKEEVVFAALEREARAAIEEDGADVIVLGSTTMHQSHAYLSEKLPVPVLNPGLVSLKLCEMFLDFGIAQSRTAYRKPEAPNDTVFDAVPPLF